MPTRRWDVWHDRAVLHFLTNGHHRERYLDQPRRCLTPGGAFVIGTFAKDGPTQCSALPVRRSGMGSPTSGDQGDEDEERVGGQQQHPGGAGQMPVALREEDGEGESREHGEGGQTNGAGVGDA